MTLRAAGAGMGCYHLTTTRYTQYKATMIQINLISKW